MISSIYKNVDLKGKITSNPTSIWLYFGVICPFKSVFCQIYIWTDLQILILSVWYRINWTSDWHTDPASLRVNNWSQVFTKRRFERKNNIKSNQYLNVFWCYLSFQICVLSDLCLSCSSDFNPVSLFSWYRSNRTSDWHTGPAVNNWSQVFTKT